MTTNTTTHPVEAYLARVLTELGDLPSGERDDLVEDLELHLREVAAETDGSLEERLGTPESYAAELRASAGLPEARPRSLRARAAVRPRSAIAGALRDPRVVRLGEFVSTLRPGWWVLRGYLAVAAPSLLRGSVPSSLPIPDVNGPWFGGALVCGAVVISVWVGLRSRGEVARWMLGAVNVTLVVLSLWAAAHLRDDLKQNAGLAQAAFETADPGSNEYSPYLLSPNGRITNIYPYDAKGHPLSGVRLYDESGNPINLPTQPDLYGRPLLNQFATTASGKRIRNAYPVRQIRAPGGRTVQAPAVKVTGATARAHDDHGHSTGGGNARHTRHNLQHRHRSRSK